VSYTALYRTFRPLKFEEVVGQEHITKTLKNQIIAGRVGHAYLLNGGRGTGKTSAAKILARAVNCLNPKDGEPCNECEICKAAIKGSLTDIVEMDAASNNSVEDIRLIRDEVNFLPTVAKYRVYIIDEVHMLSTGAFNALLKTLEEPPEHVKFILATTEPQKLPATILSRCQRFDFKKISDDNIQKRLKYICEKSKINITPEALKTISILAEGALRDALSILERCVQEGADLIDDDKVKELAGIPKVEYVNKIISSVIENNVNNTLNAIDFVINDGKDLGNLLWEIIKYVKDILIYKTTGKAELYNEKEIQQIKELAEKCSKERLLKIIYSLSELENDIKWSSQKTIMLQVGIMKLCNNNIENTSGIEELNNKIAELENRIQQLSKGVINNSSKNVENYPQNYAKFENISNQNINQEASKNINQIKQQIQNIQPNIETKSAQAQSNIAGTGVGCWNKIMTELKQNGKIMLYTNLINGKPVELNDMTLGIEFPTGLTAFGKTILERSENITELTRLISMEYGKTMQVKIIDGANKKAQVNPMDTITNSIDMPINIIDE